MSPASIHSWETTTRGSPPSYSPPSPSAQASSRPGSRQRPFSTFCNYSLLVGYSASELSSPPPYSECDPQTDPASAATVVSTKCHVMPWWDIRSNVRRCWDRYKSQFLVIYFVWSAAFLIWTWNKGNPFGDSPAANEILISIWGAVSVTYILLLWHVISKIVSGLKTISRGLGMVFKAISDFLLWLGQEQPQHDAARARAPRDLEMGSPDAGSVPGHGQAGSSGPPPAEPSPSDERKASLRPNPPSRKLFSGLVSQYLPTSPKSPHSPESAPSQSDSNIAGPSTAGPSTAGSSTAGPSLAAKGHARQRTLERILQRTGSGKPLAIRATDKRLHALYQLINANDFGSKFINVVPGALDARIQFPAPADTLDDGDDAGRGR
ncbi:hypothetical protein ABW21_db0203479 [Orbilia brochopaga]|nr:hypothetical protein ABW21_db0203479 [Drechslerella brochopaga]